MHKFQTMLFCVSVSPVFLNKPLYLTKKLITVDEAAMVSAIGSARKTPKAFCPAIKGTMYMIGMVERV